MSETRLVCGQCRREGSLTRAVAKWKLYRLKGHNRVWMCSDECTEAYRVRQALTEEPICPHCGSDRWGYVVLGTTAEHECSKCGKRWAAGELG